MRLPIHTDQTWYNYYYYIVILYRYRILYGLVVKYVIPHLILKAGDQSLIGLNLVGNVLLHVITLSYMYNLITIQCVADLPLDYSLDFVQL